MRGSKKERPPAACSLRRLRSENCATVTTGNAGRPWRRADEATEVCPMPKRRKRQRLFACVGLCAFVVNATTVAWGFVQCQEPGGRIAIERAGDHSQCEGGSTPAHDHDDAGRSPAECDACSSCSCIDTPICAALATPARKSALLRPCLLAGTCLPQLPDRHAAPTSHGLQFPTSGAAPPDEVTWRCLRSIVLLV